MKPERTVVQLRARIRELEASIGSMNNDWQAETLRKLAAEQRAEKLTEENERLREQLARADAAGVANTREWRAAVEENERLKGVVRRLLGHMSGIESAVAYALSSINAVTPGGVEQAFPTEVEQAGRLTPVALSSTELYNAAIGGNRKDSIWHGITPGRRTRLRRVVVAEPSRGCQLERIDLMGGHSDVPLLEGPIPVEDLKDGPVDVDIVIAQKSPLVLLLTGKAVGVALVLEDAP